MAKQWIQKATQKMASKGTTGSLTRMAKKAGTTPMAFANLHYHSPGLLGKKARFAVNAQRGK